MPYFDECSCRYTYKVLTMEVSNKHTALLCNKEVITVLQSYANDQQKRKRSDQNLRTITYETLQYLTETPAAVQTSESIEDVLRSLSSFSLTKAEKLQLINLRPTTAVEISLIVEESEERVSEEEIEKILDIVSRLPAPYEEDNKNADEDAINAEDES